MLEHFGSTTTWFNGPKTLRLALISYVPLYNLSEVAELHQHVVVLVLNSCT